MSAGSNAVSTTPVTLLIKEGSSRFYTLPA
jgi:hypothetical protein